MVLYSIEEISYLNNSEILLQKIKKIKTTLRKMNCTTKPTEIDTEIRINNNKMSFDLRIAFPLPHKKRFFRRKNITFYNFEEISYIKDSEILSKKIEEIKIALHNMNCTTKDTEIPTGIRIEKNKLSFDLSISFPFSHFSSVENSNE